MFINHSSKEVTAKIVYYGPGLSGKTTNLQYIFSITNPKTRGELISIETEIERTLFFDLLPINVGLVKGYQTKFQLYTVPGQVFYDSTRRLVLKGADGVVFVADSQELMKTANLESLENLKKNLAAHKHVINDIPVVYQYNKRDLNNTLPVEDLNRLLNQGNSPFFEAVATEGKGVVETLREISSMILRKIKGMLDHNEEDPGKTPPVKFDTDKRHKIIDKEDLPLKKIQADTLETAATPGLPVEPPAPAPPPPDIPEENIEEPPAEDHDLLKVETVEPADDYRDLEELVLGEDMSQVDELTDLEEIKLGDEPDEEETSGEQETVELEEHGLDADMPESDTNELTEPGGLNTIAVEDQEHFEELEGFDLSDIDNENLAAVDELPELQEIQLDDVEPPVQPQAPPEKEVKVIEDIEKSLAEPAQKKPAAAAKIAAKDAAGLDILNRLKDNTRVTVIREVSVAEQPLLIEIKDKNARLLDTVKVEISPDTKKVTLILDVKK
jgi:signal recognition particle receptor subunit beta